MDFKKYITYGLLGSLVPMTLMSFEFEDTYEKNGFNYAQNIRTMPIVFIIINLIMFTFLKSMGIENMFLIGAIFSVFMSSFGRFVAGIPTRVFEMPNPNIFHLNALVIWTIFYGFVLDYLVPLN